MEYLFYYMLFHQHQVKSGKIKAKKTQQISFTIKVFS